jgi:demethylmenaquinone methyltransferase/2-methoxy-6-polyprenyl-1,4-benzoquinol methylase
MRIKVQSVSRRSNREARALFRPLPRRYDLLAELLSFGQNRRWRTRMVDEIATGDPKLILDVATGTAGVARQIAARTQAHVVGIDITREMLQLGREKVGRDGLNHRIQLLVGTGEQLPFRDETFDALSFTYLLRYVSDPGETLRELSRVVKPEGVMANLEFLVPPNPLWRASWRFYTRVVLPAGAALGGRPWINVGRFLGPSISEHYRRYPVEWHVDAWRRAGMTQVSLERMSLGGGLVMWGIKQSE